MTSFTIPWNDEGQNRMAPRMLSRGLDRFPAASKAPSTFFDRPPTVSGKNPLSVLAPIGSGNGGKTVGKKGERGEKKGRRKDGKTVSRCKKGEIRPKDQGRPTPDVMASLPSRPVPQFSRFAVLDEIKKSQTATRQAPQLHDSSEHSARAMPSQTADRGRVRGETQAGRRGAHREHTAASLPKSTGRMSSSGPMTKRREETAEVSTKRPEQMGNVMTKRSDKMGNAMTIRPGRTAEVMTRRPRKMAETGKADSLADNKRQHESLGERVRNLLSSRSQERDKRKKYKVQKHARSDADSSPSTSDIKTGRDRNDEKQPIRAKDIALTMPHPPASRHVILSRLVYEYRKRRFKFASLRLRN